MKILHVLSTPRAEGTPRLALDWLNVKGFEQYVLFLERGNNELTPEFEAKAKKVFFNENLKDGIKKTGQIISITKKITKKVKPELVISWNTGFSSWILLGARLAGVKKLIAHAGNPAKLISTKEKLYTAVIFCINALLDVKVICCSAYVRASYCSYGFMPNRIFYYVYNCINVTKFCASKNKISSEHKKVVMVATIENHKDHKTLLDAWRIIEDLRSDIELKIVGDGSLKEEIVSYSDKLRLRNVIFTGTVTNVPEILNDSDIFVFSTTHQEGFGTVLIEAMAAGLPIIASDVPACREVLQNGKFGILVEPNSPIKLAEAIINKVEHKTNINLEDCIKYAQSFTIEKMITQYLNIVAE